MGRRPSAGRRATRSCAEAAQDGRVVYADHPDLPVVPASNMKLLTATALLDRLGLSYRFTTKLEAAAPPVGGVVHGDLYLVGGGDPLLRLASYAQSVPDGGDVYTNVEGLVTALQADGDARGDRARGGRRGPGTTRSGRRRLARRSTARRATWAPCRPSA